MGNKLSCSCAPLMRKAYRCEDSPWQTGRRRDGHLLRYDYSFFSIWCAWKKLKLLLWFSTRTSTPADVNCNFVCFISSLVISSHMNSFWSGNSFQSYHSQNKHSIVFLNWVLLLFISTIMWRIDNNKKRSFSHFQLMSKLNAYVFLIKSWKSLQSRTSDFHQRYIFR